MNTKQMSAMAANLLWELGRVEGRQRLTEARHEALVGSAAAAEQDAADGALTEAQADRVMDLVPISLRLVDRLDLRVQALRIALSALTDACDLARTARSDRKANERHAPRALPEMLRGFR
jgi:hypothetical protein